MALITGSIISLILLIFGLLIYNLLKNLGLKKKRVNPLDIYKPLVKSKHVGMLGVSQTYEDIQNNKTPLVKAFWEDNDIQEIQVISTNYGFISTYTKLYKDETEDEDSTP